jgi:hypothetical protein
MQHRNVKNLGNGIFQYGTQIGTADLPDMLVGFAKYKEPPHKVHSHANKRHAYKNRVNNHG